MFSAKIRRCLKDSINLECLLLLLAILFYEFSLVFITSNNNGLVREYETFHELDEHILECQRRNTNGAINQKICPIDNDRLKIFEQLGLDRWLNYHHIERGGHFKPDGCRSRQKVAIVVPYRNRKDHLKRFSLYIHQFLPDQLVEYSLYVIEQGDDKPFNRAKLFNVGFKEINRLDDEYCCFIFHDVDLIPLNQQNLYMCSDNPRHLSPSVNNLRFNLLYESLFGGVISMTKGQFNAIGQFSNDFYGWGGEDDDIFKRIKTAGLRIDRTPRNVGTYTMLKHRKEHPNSNRFDLLAKDLVNSSIVNNDIGYQLTKIVTEDLYTKITVKL